MKKTTTLYEKIGNRYFEHDTYLDEKGLPQGLYLFYKTNKSKEPNAMMSMLHYAKIHNIQNVPSFCDLYVAHEEKIKDAIKKVIFSDKQYSVSDLANEVINTLANIKDNE